MQLRTLSPGGGKGSLCVLRNGRVTHWSPQDSLGRSASTSPKKFIHSNKCRCEQEKDSPLHAKNIFICIYKHIVYVFIYIYTNGMQCNLGLSLARRRHGLVVRIAVRARPHGVSLTN